MATDLAAIDYGAPLLHVGEHCAVPECGDPAAVCVRGQVANNQAIRYRVCPGHEDEMWQHLADDYGIGPDDLNVGRSNAAAALF